MASQMYQKQLPVIIRFEGRDDRRTHVCVTMEMERYPGLERGRSLVIRLTDENDLCFLHTLRMANDDFHILKEQEKFLIDFDAFPRHIMDFLDLCIQEEFKNPPKYILHLHVVATQQQAESRLDVVETNEFQHVTRLKLRMTPADDSQIKKHLAECLKILRQEKLRAEALTQAAEKDGRFRLESAEEGLKKKTLELDQLHSQWNSRSSAIHEKYSTEMAQDRQKSAASLRDLQTKCEEERKNLDLSTKRTVSKLEAKIYELETVNKDISEKKSRMEGGILELKNRFVMLEEELEKRMTDLQATKRQLSDHQAKIRDSENLKSTIEEQSRKYHESVMTFQDRISVAQGQAEKLEKTLEQKEIQISRLLKDAQSQAVELNKANDIIRKMQLENRTITEKLKVRSSIVVQQEKLLEETKAQLGSANDELKNLKETLEQKEKAILDLENSLIKEGANLAEAEKSLENNANVISWLNRQLNVVNGRTIQTLHPSNTLSGLNSRFADLNIPGADHEQSSVLPSYRQFPVGTKPTTAPSMTLSPRSPSTNEPRVVNISCDDGSRDPVVDEKYLQSPLQSKAQSSGKFANLTPTSALRSVSSAYFS